MVSMSFWSSRRKMMKSKWIFLLASTLILVLALGACGPANGSATPTTVLPICPTGSLQAVSLSSPAMWAVVNSLSPTLSWAYPNPACVPEGYAIHLSTGPFFTDNLDGGTGNSSTAWGPGSPLQPGKEYAWGVQPINGTTLGPFAGSRYFFTGPMCDTAALAAPTLSQPADGSVVTDLNPTLIWEYPNPCLPQGYRVDLSTDYTFADTSLSGGTGRPTTRWGPGHPLTDCMVYFWKIAPINDTTLGPASGIFSFTTNIHGTCPTPTSPGPTPPPSPTPTPVSVGGKFFIPNFNANCRSGPDTSFPVVQVTLKGQPYLLDGQNQARTWFRIMWNTDLGCWVPAGAGAPDGDTSGLRILADVPTPTPTTVFSCSSYGDANSCNANTACQWVRNPNIITHAAYYCTSK
jgi:hypothetical protein